MTTSEAPTKGAAALAGVADQVEPLLAGTFRKEFVDDALARGGFARALEHLRTAMRTHRFEAGADRHDLADAVERLDRRTRSEGFRVLHSWNFRTHEFSRENTPVIMLDYYRDIGAVEGSERAALEILLDYYFFHLLTLCTMRAWDADDPVAFLARLDRLVELLQGDGGSGHRFVASPETLLILGMSQFHPEEAAYDRLVNKVWSLASDERRVRFARLSTAVLAAHLRWGFGVMYRRDVSRMRADNVGDYPWLLTAVRELARAYDRLGPDTSAEERDRVVEGLLNGLTPDPWALLERPPAALEAYQDDFEELRTLLGAHRDELLGDFERHRPANPARYSPLDLHFNFPHNALVAKVLLALHRGSDLNLPMDALLGSGWNAPVGTARQEQDEGAEGADENHGDDASPDAMTTAFARTLMNYSGVNPEGYDQHGAMFVVHDPRAGLRHYNMAVSTFRKHVPAAG